MPKFEAHITLLTSVSHIGESTGIEAVFHRTKMACADGIIRNIPTVTGNSIRGQLRDHAAAYLIHTLSIDEKLGLSAFYVLWSGGALQKGVDGSTLRLEQLRRLRELLPMISVWGAAVGAQILPGKLDVGMAIPVAAETVGLLPDFYADHAPMHSVYDLMQTEYYTRRDDAKDPRLEDVHTGVKDKDAAPQQMRYAVETMVAGTQLYWWFALRDAPTTLEYGAFASALNSWGRSPHLGGKGAVGHGQIKLTITDGQRAWGFGFGDDEVLIPEFLESCEADYRAHIKANRDEIIALLKEL